MSAATTPRSSVRSRIALGALAVGLAIVGMGVFSGCGSEPDRPASAERVELGEKSIRLHIGVSDHTGRRPPSDRFAIRTPDVDHWRPRFEFGRAERQFNAYPIGEDYEVYIYPRGENGPRYRLPFTMKPDMISGMPGSKTRLEIYDDSIVAVGPAVPDGQIAFARDDSSPSVGP